VSSIHEVTKATEIAPGEREDRPAYSVGLAVLWPFAERQQRGERSIGVLAERRLNQGCEVRIHGDSMPEEAGADAGSAHRRQPPRALELALPVAQRHERTFACRMSML